MNKLNFNFFRFLNFLYEKPVFTATFSFFISFIFVLVDAYNKAFLSDNHQYVEFVEKLVQVPFGSYIFLGSLFGWLFFYFFFVFGVVYMSLDLICDTTKFQNYLKSQQNKQNSLEKSDSLD